MFEIVFSTIWLLITAIVTYGFYGTNGPVEVNGELVSHAEFETMLWPKLFISLFWFIGLFIFFKGLKKVVTDFKTKVHGELCYGKVVNVKPTGTTVNGVPELKGTFIIYIPSLNETMILSEIVKYNYRKDSYVLLKYHNNDINIEKRVDSSEIDWIAKEMIDKTPVDDIYYS